MKRPYGITFEIGCSSVNGERKWFHYLGTLKLRKMRPSLGGADVEHGGLKLDIMIGSWRRPVPKIYHPKFWLRSWMSYAEWEQKFNPWNSGNHWFVLPKWLILPGLFFSISYGAGKRQPGIYIGCKSYEVNQISQNRKIYQENGNDTFLPRVAWGRPEEKSSIYLALSASIREDMVD